jgi:hypothetical protein
MGREGKGGEGVTRAGKRASARPLPLPTPPLAPTPVPPNTGKFMGQLEILLHKMYSIIYESVESKTLTK